MKKLIATLGAVALLATAANTQAADSAAINMNNFDSNVKVLAVGGTDATAFYFQILGGVDAGSMFAIVSGNTGLSSNAGVVDAGNGYFDVGIGTIPTLAPNQTGTFQVLAWQGTSGDTFATATIRVASATWSQATGSAVGSPQILTGVPLLIPGASLQLAVVPEPSTIALGVLGGLGLLLRRRK